MGQPTQTFQPVFIISDWGGEKVEAETDPQPLYPEDNQLPCKISRRLPSKNCDRLFSWQKLSCFFKDGFICGMFLYAYDYVNKF